MDNSPVIEVRFGDWITEGWNMFTRQWKAWVKMSLVAFVVTVLPIVAFMAVMYVMMLVSMFSQQHSRSTSPGIPIATLVAFYLGFIALLIVIMPLSALLMGGAYRAAFKQLRGGQVEFRDLFSARDCYLRLLGATVLHFLLIMLGAVLCIIPAFIVAGLLFFTIPLIVERNMGVFEAMRASRDLTQRRLFHFILFAFLVQLIASVGSYLCYVGLLATYPLMFTITAVAYRDCFGLEGALEGAQGFAERPPSTQSGYGPVSAVEPPPVEQPPTVCRNCNAPLPATAQFCFHCGANVAQ